MAKLSVLKGDTSRSEYIFIQDSSVTTGAGKTGLAFNTASLVAYYVRERGAATVITLATQTVTGAWSSGGFVEVDAVNMPGIYRLDIPDAVFATGVDKGVVMLKGAANMAPITLEYQLIGYDPENAVSLGLSNLNTTVSSRAAAGDAMALTAAERLAVADATLTRDMDQVEGAAAIHSLCTAVLKLVSRFKASTGETYKTNGTTVKMTQAVLHDAITAISELGVGA